MLDNSRSQTSKSRRKKGIIQGSPARVEPEPASQNDLEELELDDIQPVEKQEQPLTQSEIRSKELKSKFKE